MSVALPLRRVILSLPMVVVSFLLQQDAPPRSLLKHPVSPRAKQGWNRRCREGKPVSQVMGVDYETMLKDKL